MVGDTNRRRYLKGLGTVGVAGLAGCLGGGGGDGDGTTQDQNGGDETTQDQNGGGEKTTWSLASNPSDSPPFTWGAVLQNLLSRESDRLAMQPVSTTGFLDNFNRVSTGENDAGLSSATAYWSAKKGTTPYDEPQDRLAVGISPVIHKSGIYLATYQDSDIETLDDLAGKTFSYLHRGAATNPLNQAIFEEAGVLDEMETVYQGFSDTRSAVVERRIDAWQHLYFDGYYHGGAEVEQSEAVGGVKHIPVPEDIRNAVMEKFSDGWTYNELDPSIADIDIEGDRIDYFFTPSQVYVEPDKSDDLVYHLTQLMVENQDWLSDQNNVFHTYGFGESPAPVGERFGFEGLSREQFHPGALQYYDEEGMEVPE